MDSIALVGGQIEAGRRLLDRLIENGFDVTAACLLRVPDQSDWDLYIASRTVDDLGLQKAAEAMHPVFWVMRPQLVDPLSVRLTGTTGPIGTDLAKLQQRFPGGGVLYHGGTLGNLFVEQAYIYPPTGSGAAGIRNVVVNVPAIGAQATVLPPQPPMTPDEVAHKMLDLMNRPAPVPSGVLLHDGTSFQGVPFGVERNGGALQAKFTSLPTGEHRVVSVKDIVSLEETAS